MCNDYSYIYKAFLNDLRRGHCPWYFPKAKELPVNFSSHEKYFGINALNLMNSNFSVNVYGTEKDIKQHGYKLKKDAIPQLILKYYKYDGEEHKYKTDLVYNSAQIEGFDYGKHVFYYEIPIKKCGVVEEFYLRHAGFSKVNRGAKATEYRSDEDSLSISFASEFEDYTFYYAFLFRAFVDSCRHSDRLGEKYYLSQYLQSEMLYDLIAELAVFYLCAHCGIKNHLSTTSKIKLQNWGEMLGKRTSLIYECTSKAHRIANYILHNI